jgi:transcriptional regulator with XRE-family HTH domain
MSSQAKEPYPHSWFGDVLAFARTNRGLTQQQLGMALGLTRSTIASWEIGTSLPSKEQVFQIGRVSKLNESEINALLYAARYELIPNVAPDSYLLVESPVVERSKSNEETVSADTVREIQVQIKDIQGSIEALSGKIDNGSLGDTEVGSLALVEELQNAKDSLRRLQTTSNQIMAPVSIPSSHELTVKLVPSMLLERLEEYRTEENKWSSWLGVFAGAILGVFINLATGGTMTNQAWVVLAILLIVMILVGRSAWVYRQRANTLKVQLLASNEGDRALDKEK